MLQLNRKITLALVDTYYHDLSRLALIKCITEFDVSEIIIFSDRNFEITGAKHVSIEKFSEKEEYNNVILTSLPDYLNTDHCLIVQYDGFILKPELWSDTFTEFDYIGAPWPNYTYHCVGNGGFCLRSRRLVESAARLSAYRTRGDPEDVFIARTIRPLLESSQRCRFADNQTALRFAFESPGHPKTAFGFHGVLNMAIAYADRIEEFFQSAPLSLLRTRTTELLFGTHFIEPKLRDKFVSLLGEHLAQPSE